MKKRLKCLIGMFVLVCFYAFYYWGLPAILNLEKLSPIITAYIKKEYGYNIKMVHPNLKMGLTPTLWLKADSFEVLNDNNTKAVSINAPKVEISLLPLIIGRINLNYFSASDLFADVSYDDKFNVKIGQYLLIRASDFIVDINNSKIFLNKFAINLYDTSKNKKIVLDGTYFNIYEFNKKKVLKSDSDINIIAGKNVAHLNFSIDTKLPFNRHLDDYPPEISATVTNLNLSDFSDLIKLATKDNISSLNGLLNAEFRSAQEITDQKQYLSRAALENFAINSKYVDKPYKYPYKIQIKSNYLLDKNHLNIPAIDFTTPKFSTKIFGSIDKISTKKPIPNLHVKMFNAKANDLLEIIPYSSYLDKLATINISVAKAVNFNANVDVNLNIKNNFEKPDIFGDIKLSNAYIYEPIKKAPQGAKINISYDKDVLLLDVNVPTESTQEVNVKGKIFIYDDKKVDLHITSTDSIDLALAEKLLDPIQRTLIFPLGPVPIMGFSGYGSIDLIVKGNEKDPYALGWFKAKNATVSFDDIKNLYLTNGNAILEFLEKTTKFTLNSGLVKGKKVSISGVCDLTGKFNFNAEMNKQNLGDLLLILKTSPLLKDLSKSVSMIDFATGLADFKLNIFGELLDVKDLDFGKNVHAKGDIHLLSNGILFNNQSSLIKNISGDIKYEDTNIKLDLNSKINNANIFINGNIINDKANIALKTDTIRVYDLLKSIKIPNLYIAGKRNEDSSYINLECRYNGNLDKIDTSKLSANGKVFFKNTNLIYAKNKFPIKIISGDIQINNDVLSINKLNSSFGTMPTIIDGKIRNIFTKKPHLDIYLSSRPNQKFFDYIYNKNAIYPIKAKGEISCTTTLNGTTDKINTHALLKLSKNSSLYYMGSTIGDANMPIQMTFDGVLEPSSIKIKNFYYDKMVASQNHRLYPRRQLTASGTISDTNKIPVFRNLKIKTSVPTDMKIFNIIFKKPLIKEGYFNSNIELNGSAMYPQILGHITTTGTNIPFFDTSIKTINLNFTPKEIIGKLNGDVLSNSFTLDIKALNNLKPPYILNYAKLEAKNVNIDYILNTLREYEIESVKTAKSSSVQTNLLNFDLNQLIINKLNVVANNILVYNILAKDLFADISMKNGNIKVDKFNFLMAKGTMKGSVNYNISAKKYNFNLDVTGADANTLLSSLFDVKGQLYGDLGGSLDLSCVGDEQEECLKTLNGKANFLIKNGRMPKLGSLEYLLKAGNLIKSGITGISINSIIDLASPLKTGNFDSIKGSIKLNNGIAEKIQILSTGKDLNIYVIGDYNLADYNANMYVFGRLSRKISTLLGPVGNLSLNTLFNTIPGIDLNDLSNARIVNELNKIPGLELSNKLYRVFAVEIHGNIDGDDYVQSFRWVE